MKKTTLIIFLSLAPFLLFAQEMLIGLGCNPKILSSKLPSHMVKSSVPKPLPFFDDFSSENIFPADSLWEDKNVFINSDYPLHPVSIGVATFDALDSKGKLYSQAISTAFPADSLTSVKIRLDSIFGSSPGPIKISDSTYFSFFYQPQGIGNAPERDDSLLLEFYSESSAKWFKVWSAPGTTMQDFLDTNHCYFKIVMISLNDSLDSVRYFSKNFQFRFRNFASLANNSLPSWAGNVDQWNIDYVLLDVHRSKADSIFKDITFVEKAPSMLKNYQAMPWKQYLANTTAEMKDSLNIFISNLSMDTINSSYKYNIFDETGTSILLQDGGNWNLYPFFTSGYQTYLPHAHPPVPVGWTFPTTSGDSASFKIVHVIKDGLIGDYHPQNDTIKFNQNFYNYYAYDDGCPEAGYGLSEVNAKLAYRFNLNIADTIRAIDIFWNRTYNDVSQKYFYLTIWSSLTPENIIYQKSGFKPQYEDSLNKFYRYILDTPIAVSGTFYIGWRQTTIDNLNVGFDRNTNSNSNIFYTASGIWYSSMYNGSLMMRPVLGKQLPIGVQETATISSDIKLFPNPVSDHILHFRLENPEQIKELSQIKVFDLTGRIVCLAPFSTTLNLPDLQNGLYFLMIFDKKNVSVFKEKFIISN